MFVRAQNTARLTKNNVILIVLMLVSLGQCLPSPKIIKRMAVEDNGAMEYPDYQTGVQYDEYPMVVPKRAALLLDRMMVAIQKAMEDEKSAQRSSGGNRWVSSDDSNSNPWNATKSTEHQMELQRRGHESSSVDGQHHKGRTYWRCYFNAVTCF
ncbi:uncharacterized protein LOC123293597 [Chrysoperla carnea]|uniref:uncharacterized protein LOC123293597 n=1 Tax=Chrysoperla carnea TaxID=189513 RepID=UPI001D075AD1|nr:uncharacterized protein LOC123293597 [Chrysoperla carnea]